MFQGFLGVFIDIGTADAVISVEEVFDSVLHSGDNRNVVVVEGVFCADTDHQGTEAGMKFTSLSTLFFQFVLKPVFLAGTFDFLFDFVDPILLVGYTRSFGKFVFDLVAALFLLFEFGVSRVFLCLLGLDIALDFADLV